MNPFPEYRGHVQKMTTENGEQKGLQQTLEEGGFDVKKLQANCSSVSPFENDTNCCMARLLSKQEDFTNHFTNQISMPLETVIQEAGHDCIILPKFHYKFNPIEMVSSLYLLRYSLM
jgi:hypothetical protein